MDPADSDSQATPVLPRSRDRLADAQPCSALDSPAARFVDRSAALPDSHVLTSRKRIRIIELKNERWVFYPRHLAPACYDAVYRMCGASGFRPEVVHESNGVSVSLSLIPALQAVTLFPECIRCQKAEGVAYRDLEGKHVTVTCGFLRRLGDRALPAERFLRTWRAATVEKRSDIHPIRKIMG